MIYVHESAEEMTGALQRDLGLLRWEHQKKKYPACHFHMHFSRIEDLPLCPLALDDSHNNDEGSLDLCAILHLSSWGLISEEMWTLAVFLWLLYDRTVPQMIWRKVMSKVLRKEKEQPLLGHC